MNETRVNSPLPKGAPSRSPRKPLSAQRLLSGLRLIVTMGVALATMCWAVTAASAAEPWVTALTFINKTTTDGLGSNGVLGVYASGSTIYAATIGGLSISTDGGTTFINKTTTDGLGSNVVYGVYASGSTIYAATYGGLGFGVGQPVLPPTGGNPVGLMMLGLAMIGVGAAGLGVTARRRGTIAS